MKDIPDKIHSVVNSGFVRLTVRDIQGLQKAFEQVCRPQDVKNVYLFGSRVNLSAKGGDIDLLIECRKKPEEDLLRLSRTLRLAMYDYIGEQKIDLVWKYPGKEDAFVNMIDQDKVLLMTTEHIVNEKEQQRITYLREQLDLASRAAAILEVSYHHVQQLLPLQEPFSHEVLIELDALTTRFARLSDLLIQRVFRGVDAIELIDEGTLFDRLNRAENRGIIDSAENWRMIRELRNQIAHEYVLDNLHGLFDAIIRHTPAVISCAARIETYLQEHNLIEPPVESETAHE